MDSNRGLKSSQFISLTLLHHPDALSPCFSQLAMGPVTGHPALACSDLGGKGRSDTTHGFGLAETGIFQSRLVYAA